IVIGQAAEFDYAGTQACKALREEGVRTVLVNSNPATIMTDEGVADRVYIEPLTIEAVTAIIERERPDGLLATLGGQTGLNLAVALADAGVLERCQVRVLGTPLAAIREAEDREAFKNVLLRTGEPAPDSRTVNTVDAADSIVVAPSQTLSDRQYQMLRSAALRIIRALRIEGGCNVQFALDPASDQYYVIEVNPRVSRSSALASKATGYPIARVAAK